MEEDRGRLRGLRDGWRRLRAGLGRRRRLVHGAVGALFLVAGGSKVYDQVAETAQLTKVLHRLNISHFSGVALPILQSVVAAELLLGTLLVLGRAVRLAVWGAALLLAVYSLYLGVVWVRLGPEGTCACISLLPQVPAWAGLLRNVVLLGLLIGAGLPRTSVRDAASLASLPGGRRR